ncbi:MAG: cytochrome c2 [Oceanicoccus sp.]|jgi:cytochrome c2
MLSRFTVVTVFCAALFTSSMVYSQSYTEQALKAADVVAGEQTWQQYCAFCHTLRKGEADITGPNLDQLFKRKVGTKDGFKYSEALLKDTRNWTPEFFAEYVQNPSAVIPGNAMPSINIPADKVLPLTAYVMRKSNSVDWDAAAASTQSTGGLDAELRDKKPAFWNLYMENTVKFTLPYKDRSYSFVAYFNDDGTVTGNNRGLQGIWRMRDKRNFCFAIQRIAVHPYEFMHCMRPKVPKDIQFGQEVEPIKPVKGFDDFTIGMGFLEGRPHPLEGDAHPDYWTFLFANTMRYEIKVNKKKEIVDVFFQRDNTITSAQGATGEWRTEGDAGKADKLCYRLSGVPGIDGDLSECFALVLMFNPRVGARWPARFEQGNTYWAEVTEGRPSND